MNLFFNRLKKAIKESKISQKKIAAIIDVSTNTMSRIVRGEVDPGVSKIEKIAAYLNINHSWLFTGRGPMFYPELKQEYGMVSDPPQQHEPFNRTTDEFTELALKIIRDEQITQEELVAAIREVRRRRRPGSVKHGANTVDDLPVKNVELRPENRVIKLDKGN